MWCFHKNLNFVLMVWICLLFCFLIFFPSLLASLACNFDFSTPLGELSSLDFLSWFWTFKLSKYMIFSNLNFPLCAWDFKNKFPIWLFKSIKHIIELAKREGGSMLDVHLGIHAQGGPHMCVWNFSLISSFSFLLLISLIPSQRRPQSWISPTEIKRIIQP